MPKEVTASSIQEERRRLGSSQMSTLSQVIFSRRYPS